MTAKNRRERIHGPLMSAVANAIGRFQDVCAGALGSLDLNAPARGDLDSFQCRAGDWMTECFGPLKPSRRPVRMHRFVEEALEFAQSLDMPKEEALALVNYVYGRPKGDPCQEVGGVMVTLAGACSANGIDLHDAAEIELDRCWQNTDKIKAKNAAKPDFAEAAPSPVEPVGLTRELAFRLYAAAARASTEYFRVMRQPTLSIDALDGRMETLSGFVAMLRADFAADIANAPEAVPAPHRNADRTWFWRIVDAYGLADVPSEEEPALRLILKRLEEMETAGSTTAVERALASSLYEGAYTVAMAQRAAENGTGFKSRVERSIKRELEPALSAYYQHHKPAEVAVAA